jgi:hypothetical protein
VVVLLSLLLLMLLLLLLVLLNELVVAVTVKVGMRQRVVRGRRCGGRGR